MLCCPAPFLQYRFCGSAFCRVYSELRFIGLLFCCVYSASVLRFAFLPRLFRASLYRFAFLPHLFSFASLVSLFAAFSCSRFPCFVSQTLFILLFLFVSSAMFLLPRFSCSVFQSAKSLKKCFKNFYGLAKSVSRPYPYHIYSNFIQSYSKNQDSICFFSRLLLLLVLLLKRAALLKVEPPVLY